MEPVNVVLVPANFIEISLLEFIGERLPEAYPVNVRIDERGIRVPPHVYDKERDGMIKSEKLITYLRAVDRWRLDEKVIIIVDDDGYATNTNFIFGQAEVNGKFGVVYLARLRPYEQDDELLYVRALKEVSHELGHLFGLDHCFNPKCVMSFSETIEEVDRKDWRPCNSCLEKLFKLMAMR